MSLKNRYLRIAAIILASCLTLLLIVWAVAGPVAKPQVVKWLKSQGAQTATIQSVVFNPFRPSIQIKALTVNGDMGKPLYLERAYARLSWLGLLHKEVRIRHVEIHNLNLKVHQGAEEVTVGGLKPASGEAAESSAEGQAQPLDWLLRLDNLVIAASRLDFTSPDFTGVLELAQLQFKDGLLSEQVVSGALAFSGRFNEAPLHFDTQVDIQKGKGTLKGKLDLDQLALEAFQPLFKAAVSQLGGNVSLQTNWQVDIEGRTFALDQAIKVKLADMAVETPDMILGQKQGDFQVDLAARADGQQIEMVHIKQLGLSDAQLALALKKKPPQGDQKSQGKAQKPVSDTVAEKSKPQPPAVGIQIDSVEVSGDTRIDFSDHNLDPPFKEQIRHLNFKISDLDNRQLEKPSPFTLSAEIQKYGKLNFSGMLKPFSRDLYADITGRISEYGLPPVSGYTHSMLGYNIRTGQLNADVALKIENRLLDGQTQFDFQALKLDPSAKGTSDKLTTQVTMPLDLALGYISDDKGNLQLNMPIKGSLDDPQFGITHLCRIVMVKAAQSAAYSYLKNMLLPYGALVQLGFDVAVMAGQKMMALKLAPLVYPPGKVQPGPESKVYVDQLVALMTKEPKMRLIICGVATNADLGPTRPAGISEAKLEKQMLALARERMAAFKQMLIQNHGIASSRLLDCYPRVDTEPEGKPRIEIDL